MEQNIQNNNMIRNNNINQNNVMNQNNNMIQNNNIIRNNNIIQNNARLNGIFRQLVGASSNMSFNFIIRPMYRNEREEELAFSSFIQPNCQSGYTGANRYLD